MRDIRRNVLPKFIELYENAMLVPLSGAPIETSVTKFFINIKSVILFLRTVQIANLPK